MNTDKLFSKMERIDQLQKEIAKYEQNISLISQEITQYLLANIQDWHPNKDERAVCFSPKDQTAWYVWFIEQRGDFYRFKETPSWEPRIRNYYSQDMKLAEGGELVIIPLKLFNTLNEKFKIEVYNKLEVIS